VFYTLRNLLYLLYSLTFTLCIGNCIRNRWSAIRSEAHEWFRTGEYSVALSRLKCDFVVNWIHYIIMYKQQFLCSNQLAKIRRQLVPNLRNFLSAEKWNGAQTGEINIDWQLGTKLSSNWQNGEQTLDKNWNHLSRFLCRDFKTSQGADLSRNY